MVDLDVLKKHGLTDENMRKWFDGDPKLWLDREKNTTYATSDDENKTAAEKRAALHNRIRSRIQEGMQRNWEDYRVHSVMDKAWDQPFYQITPTILAQFIDSDPANEDVKKQLDNWGLAHLITDELDPKTGKPVKKLNLPVFFRIFVPLVRSYITIRWAKIMNDRRQSPFFKYEPFKQTTELRLKCEAITDRINVMANQYGYYDVMKQAVHKMLLYSYCIQFVTKEWDYEETRRAATKEDVLLGKTKPEPTEDDKEKRVPVKEGDEIKVTDREGLTYHHPHPARTFWDMSAGKHTINYDYGVKWSGYWKIVRYRELKENGFWNTGTVRIGDTDLVNPRAAYFNAVYASALTIHYPTYRPPTPSAEASAAEMSTGIGPLDRERQLGYQYYGSVNDDQGVLTTEYFEKLIPKDNGMGDYDCPVWFRFVMAGDGGTMMYAAPLPYNPMVYYGYDADESRAKNPSLGLEVLPFQDHFSNTLTQIILTAKQNLANMVFVDTDQVVDQNTMDKLGNSGGAFYQGLNLVPISGRKAYKTQQRVTDAVQSFGLPKGNVAELTNVLKTILDVLERILVMSSQEVAQAASHEQTREEVRIIAGSTSTRLQFTSTPVDIATSAWKRQLYQGLMAYGDDDLWAMLPSDIPLTKEVIEKMGFTAVDKDSISKGDRFVKVRLKKNTTAMDLWTFASTRDDIDRSSDKDVAVAMASILRDLLNNPITAQAIGPDQAIELTNQIARLAGLPRDLKFRNMAPDATEEQRRAEAMEQIKAVVDIVMKEVQPLIQSGIKPIMEHDKGQDAELQNQSRQMALMMPVLGDIMTRLNIAPPPELATPAGGGPM